MAAYLLVAHQTAESDELLAAARELHGQDPHARFTMLVPATPVDHLLVWEEGETRELARRAAETAAARLRSHGLEVVEATVGDPDPVHAIGDELRRRRHRYHAIVLSTLPAGVSRWLRMDAVSRVRRRYPKMRVVHVESRVPTSAPRQG
jgi:hypothetical protein